MGIIAAIPRTVLVDAAQVTLQKWARSCASFPGVRFTVLRFLQIRVDELLAIHAEATRNSTNLFLAERRLQFATTVGAGSAVNSSPYTFGNLGHAAVNI